MVGLSTGELKRLTGVPQSTLADWQAEIGLRPSIKKSNKRGKGGSRWSMRDAINVSILKTLSDWGVPRGQLREACRLLKSATEQELKNSWIVAIENKPAVALDVMLLGCKALGIELDEEGNLATIPPGLARDLGYEPENPKSMEALGERVNIEGSKSFTYDHRRHFSYQLVSNQEELARLTAREGVDCRIHSLHRQVTGTLEKARALGLARGKRRVAN